MSIHAQTVTTEKPSLGSLVANTVKADIIYNRLRQSICEIHDTNRISAVEKRVLLELTHDMKRSLIQMSGRWLLLTPEEITLINRARDLSRLTGGDDSHTWVEAVVLAITEQGYQTPKMWDTCPITPPLVEELKARLKKREDAILDMVHELGGPQRGIDTIGNFREGIRELKADCNSARQMISKVQAALFDEDCRPIDINNMLTEIKGLKSVKRTMEIVQHILGAAPTREHIIGSLDQLKGDLTQARMEKAALEQEAIKLRHDARHWEQSYKHAFEMIGTQEKVVKSLEQGEQAARAIIDTARTQIAGMEAEITRLNGELAKGVELLQNTCREKSTQMAGMDIEITRLREEVTDRVSERGHLAENIRRLEGEIDTLTKQNQELKAGIIPTPLYHVVQANYKNEPAGAGLANETTFDHNNKVWARWPLQEALRYLVNAANRGFIVTLQEVRP